MLSYFPFAVRSIGVWVAVWFLWLPLTAWYLYVAKISNSKFDTYLDFALWGGAFFVFGVLVDPIGLVVYLLLGLRVLGRMEIDKIPMPT